MIINQPKLVVIKYNITKNIWWETMPGSWKDPIVHIYFTWPDDVYLKICVKIDS